MNNSNLFSSLWKEPARPAGQKDAIELRCEPMDKVRVAFVGLGMRVASTLKRFVHIQDAEIRVICDISSERIDQAVNTLKEFGRTNVEVFTHEDDWKRICEREDVDLIYISTHYDLHVPIATYAMENGKHAAIEVPAATSIADCWKLVETSERTRRHCMQLENCNYGAFEMATLHMVQSGLLGEVVHAEGAYIHDLKKLIFDSESGYWNMWRLKYHERKNGNLYPTHGLGPIAHALNIHRGDGFDHLVSMSSGQFNLTHYATANFGADSSYARKTYRNGDMNTTLIRTRKGKTIMLQHDITSPRPYSRIHLLSGTGGFAQKWPRQVVSLAPDGMTALDDDQMDALLKKYEHPLRKKLGPTIEKLGKNICEIAKNDGMDYMMDYRLIYCLKHGLPLDLDVYDAAEWSSIIELSEHSVENGSMPIRFPDYTRGAHSKVRRLRYFDV